MTKPIINYFVNDGPDTRHFVNTKMFLKLKDAKSYVKQLSPKRAYRLTRLESPSGFSTKNTKSKVLDQRII
jgi:hypothetical protein